MHAIDMLLSARNAAISVCELLMPLQFSCKIRVCGTDLSVVLVVEANDDESEASAVR